MSELTQCESFDGMSNARCCYHSGHSGDHFYSREDESDRIRWKLAADERNRLRAENAELRAEMANLESNLRAFRERDDERADAMETLAAKLVETQAEVARLRFYETTSAAEAIRKLAAVTAERDSALDYYKRDEVMYARLINEARAQRDSALREADGMRAVVVAAIKYVGPDGEDASELDTAVEAYLATSAKGGGK